MTKGEAIKRFLEFNQTLESQMEVMHRKLNGLSKRVKQNSGINVSGGASLQGQQYANITGKNGQINFGSKSVHFQLPSQSSKPQLD